MDRVTFLQRRRAAIGAALVAGVLSGACGGDAVDGTGRSFLGPWTDRTGRPLPDGDAGEGLVAHSYRAPEHCADLWGSVVFLWLAWPIGSELPQGDSLIENPKVRQFVRDPEGVFGPGSGAYSESIGSFGVAVSLPLDARPTNVFRGGWRIWWSEDDAGAVYMVRGESVERWPALEEPAMCV